MTFTQQAPVTILHHFLSFIHFIAQFLNFISKVLEGKEKNGIYLT